MQNFAFVFQMVTELWEEGKYFYMYLQKSESQYPAENWAS